MAAQYEWDIEEWEDGDVIDHCHEARLAQYPASQLTEIDGTKYRLVLVYSHWLPNGDLEERTWAYVKDGMLPKTFEDGFPVPKYFHEELDRTMKNHLLRN